MSQTKIRKEPPIQTAVSDLVMRQIEPLNPTGIRPCEDKILVRLDPVSDTVGKLGIIVAPDSHRASHQHAQTYATLIAVGGNAFEDWKDPIPKPGDRIVINKYAGLPPKAGDIENLYRLASASEVIAILEE